MNRIDAFIVACQTFKEFRSRVSALTEKEKGDLFERVVQRYLQTAPEYRAVLTHVWLLRETPARVLAEIGLDLLAHAG